MKTKLTMLVAMSAACAAGQLKAMPTEEETRQAEPSVQKMLAPERAALKSGQKTRAEVAATAMKLVDKADTDAAKLLLMKGAFVLYVRAGEFDKAIETLDTMLTDIPDMSPASVVNIMEETLRAVPRKQGEPLYRLLDNLKSRTRSTADAKDRAQNAGYTFSYKLEDGFATITEIVPKPAGTLVVPDQIDGHVVTGIEGYNDRSPFWGCDQLTKVVLPAGLAFESFDAGVFLSCKALASIDIPQSNKDFASLDGVLYSKDLSTLCVYPKTRETIEISPKTKKVAVCAFRGCALKTAKIPEGVEEMERWNLCECPNLESVEFPASLKSLGACAVTGSDKVKKIVFNGEAPRADVACYANGLKQGLFTGAPADLVVEVRRGSKGWLAPDNIELPERWPTDQEESRPIRHMGPEANRQLFSKMFPGWEPSVEPSIVSSHRGEKDVAFVHPPSQETPAIVSRTLTLSNANPCLFLKMASFSKDYDFLLSVLVNGKEVLPKRLVRTPDDAPWEDITIPLFAWRGEEVKIEIVLTANNWYCEHPFFKRLEVAEAFSLNAAPGSVTTIDLGNVPPLQFVSCPAGKFTMGYKERPALSKVKDIEITSPFWVSKTCIRADQLLSLGLVTTMGEAGDAVVNDASIVVKELPSALKDRFGKMLPPGYAFRLPTEAEFEYLQKAETKDGDVNIWGVERLHSVGLIALLDRAPPYGRGVDVVNRRSGGTVWTDLVKVNYENQPDKDPVGWTDDPDWSVFRRGKDLGKLLTGQRAKFAYNIYFVVAPDVDKLNKFYWK